jgi:hypothetical protein
MVVEQWVVEVEGWKAGFLALRRSRHYADTNGKLLSGTRPALGPPLQHFYHA